MAWPCGHSTRSTTTELELLFGTLTPITRLVIDGGDIPAATPMGLRRDDLDDDGAHLD